MLKLNSIVLGSFVALSMNPAANADNKIVGGRAVQPADPEARHTVALLTMSQDSNSIRDAEGLCTGTLIAEDTVLTAAHCVGSAPPSRLKVVFTLHLRTAQSADFRRVTAFKANPMRIITPILIRNDIAIVHFEGGLKAGYQVAPLLPRSERLEAGETVTLAGFGLASAGDQRTIGPMRAVEVQVDEPLRLRRQVRFDQSNGRGACNGDSGGPAFLTRQGVTYVWGVTSYGTASCLAKAYYTNASQYAGWIARTMDNLRYKQ